MSEYDVKKTCSLPNLCASFKPMILAADAKVTIQLLHVLSLQCQTIVLYVYDNNNMDTDMYAVDNCT